MRDTIILDKKFQPLESEKQILLQIVETKYSFLNVSYM